MIHVSMSRPNQPHRAAAHRTAPASEERRALSTHECLEERQFLTMECAFARHGGMASGDEVALRMRDRSDQPISVLARWIVERAILSFEWKGQTMIPLFQFDLREMSLRPEAQAVINELASVFDDWELAVWFAQPNVWLHEASPVDVLSGGPTSVLQAARADRFVARG